MAGNGDDCNQSSIMMQPWELQDKEVDTYDNQLLTPITPLPRKELFIIWIVHASQGFQTTMLFPMLVFMVDKYGVAGKESHAMGYYAGLLASLFPLAQFCSSILWGILSDKYGRRPWLAFGNAVSAASSLLLGLSQTFGSACIIRFLGGLLNGTLTITKSALAELCDRTSGLRSSYWTITFCILLKPRTNQAKGFGILNLAWGIGAIAGSIFSGMLAEPCIQYTKSHCPILLQTYPFMLPCLSATIFSSIAACSTLFLRETNPQIIMKKRQYQQVLSRRGCLDAGDSSIHCGFRSSELQMKKSWNPDTKGFYSHEMDAESKSFLNLDTQFTQRLMVTNAMGEDVLQKDLDCSAPGLDSTSTTTFVDSSLVPQRSIALLSTTMSVLKDRDVLLSSFCYSMTGLIFIITDELFPMFGASPRTIGGLGFSSTNLGIVLGEGGLVLFIYTLLLYPQVAKRWGPLCCFRYGIIGSVPLWLLFPACSMLSSHPVRLWLTLIFTMSARSIVACTTFTGILILVSNSANSSNMGVVIGFSHSLCSFFRAIGPALGGAMWSYASTKTFPLHQFLAWLFVALLSICTFGLSYLLPPTLVCPKNSR